MQNHNKKNPCQILSILVSFNVNPHLLHKPLLSSNSAAVFISHYSIQKHEKKISKKNIAIHNVRGIKRVGKKVEDEQAQREAGVN